MKKQLELKQKLALIEMENLDLRSNADLKQQISQA